MKYWIIPANSKRYDYVSAFEKQEFIDWTKNQKYEIGDIVYIYCSKPFQKIMYKTMIEKIFISYNAEVNDKEFWCNKEEFEKNKYQKKEFVRLKLLNYVNNDSLSLERLMKNGLKKAPQGAMKVQEKFLEYIEQHMKKNKEGNIFLDIDDGIENLYEGILKTITVNKYERSKIAREKCIEYHGCKCSICDLNFEEMYGDIGKGFIHIHHIVPLNQIKKEYKINYKRDLIPVCPNCHAMLHRKINDKELTINELKKILDMRRKK